MDKQYMAMGTVTVPDPAAAQTITCGFAPRYVRAINVNNLTSYEHFDGMADGTSIDMGNHDSAQVSVNAAGSITLTADGFTLGADICDTAEDVVRWVAFR